jgi:hypothetical protein
VNVCVVFSIFKYLTMQLFLFLSSIYIFFFSLYKNIYVTYVTSSSTITCLLDGWKRGEAIIERWRQSGAWSMRSDICVSTAQCGVSDGTEKETKRNERKHRVNVISMRKKKLPPPFFFSFFVSNLFHKPKYLILVLI